MWALVVATVEKDAFNRLPTEVMPSVALLKVYNISKAHMYTFRIFGEDLLLRCEDGAELEGHERHV